MVIAKKLHPETRFSVSGQPGVFVKTHDVGNTTYAKTVFGNTPEDVGTIVEIPGDSPCYIIPTAQRNNKGGKKGKANVEAKPSRKSKLPSEYLVLLVVHEDKGEILRIEHPTALKLTAFSNADTIRITEGAFKGEYEVDHSAFEVETNTFYLVVLSR